MTMTTTTARAKRTAIEDEVRGLIAYRDRVQADLDGLPDHLKAHAMGIDRMKQVEAVNRDIERLLRSR
jgi:hypothetical protein